ncbi:MAG: FtsX-like permease family protein [Vicinamibacterales bacterium]
MALPFELFVALRYLFAGRKQAFISVISLVSILGVTVGVMALVIALALTTGLQGEMRDRIVGASAHIYVWKMGEGGVQDAAGEVAKLVRFPGVVGAAPVTLGKALVTTSQGEQFITVKGVDPTLEAGITEVASKMTAGSLGALATPIDEGLDGIVIGKGLAEQLGVAVDDTVTVLTPEGTLSPMGVMPRSRRLRVVGIFSVGLFEFDTAYGFVTLPVANRLRGKDHPDFIELKVDDIYRAREISNSIAEALGTEQYLVQDWTSLNRSLFSALWLEKMVVSITIGLIVIVAALNIVASLILLVMEKTRDIAILKTMGASPRAIMRIFMLQGLVIGTVGTAVGATIGYAICRVLDTYEVIQIPMDVYQVSHVPFKVLPTDFLVVVVTGVIVCFIATIYPSRQASKLDPAQALRYQ